MNKFILLTKVYFVNQWGKGRTFGIMVVFLNDKSSLLFLSNVPTTPFYM